MKSNLCVSELFDSVFQLYELELLTIINKMSKIDAFKLDYSQQKHWSKLTDLKKQQFVNSKMSSIFQIRIFFIQVNAWNYNKLRINMINILLPRHTYKPHGILWKQLVV